MPTAIIRDAFVRELTWEKALREAVRTHREKQSDTTAAFKTPAQISYFDRIERGLSVVLTIGVSGQRTFSVMTYPGGKPRIRKLGVYPMLSVKEARQKAREYWLDPARYEQQASVGTFREVADGWLARHVKARGLRSAEEIERQLHKYVYPRVGHYKFIEVRRTQIADLLDDIAAKHGPAQADACLATVRAIMNWYQSRDEHYTTPIVPGMRRYEAKSRERILNDEEIRAIWTHAEGTFGALVKLALFTGQRKTKLGTVKWTDIVDGEWVIATEPREKGNAGRLRLSTAAMEVLRSLPRLAGNEFVFPGHGGGPFTRWSEMKDSLDKRLKADGFDLPRWTIHDLRRTARSLMSRAGVLPHIAEQVLGHVQPGVVGVYDRHRYDDEKAHALNRLAQVLHSILQPKDNVIVLADHYYQSETTAL